MQQNTVQKHKQKDTTTSHSPATPSSMAVMIEDDISLDDIEGDNASGDTFIVPNFLPATWDIMRQLPHTSEEARMATKACILCKTFSTPLCNLERVWFLLDKEEL